MFSSLNKYWRALVLAVGAIAMFVSGDVTQGSTMLLSAITGIAG